MKSSLFGLAVVAAATAWSALAAQDPALPPPCEPGYKYVPTTEYKEVESYVCKLVPYTKKTKKWVYTYKDAPFCIHQSKGFLCLFDDPRCLGPFQRKLLVKKEIVVKEEQATRCVAEKVVTKVPCTVLRKVPVGAAPEKLGRPLTPVPALSK